MSVVAALSEWLVHTNRRCNGSWTQRYEHGLPVTGLVPIEENTATGITIHCLPDGTVRTTSSVSASLITRLANSWPSLTTNVVDERP